MNERHCIDDRCKGCERIAHMEWLVTGAMVPVCSTYLYPRTWWEHRGGCPFLFKPEVKKEFVRTGQQKQKKRK